MVNSVLHARRFSSTPLDPHRANRAGQCSEGQVRGQMSRHCLMSKERRSFMISRGLTKDSTGAAEASFLWYPKYSAAARSTQALDRRTHRLLTIITTHQKQRSKTNTLTNR